MNAFRKGQIKLRKAQRRIAKKKKFSENWKKHKKKLQKIYNKIGSIRKDFQHKISTKLSKNHAMIVTECLKFKNMSRSANATIDKHGKNVQARSALNTSILDQGWGAINPPRGKPRGIESRIVATG